MNEIYSLNELVDNMPCAYGEDLGKYSYVADVAKVSNISADGHFKKDYEKRSFREKEIEYLLVEKDDLLVVKSSGSKANILSGKTAICTDLEGGHLVASNFLLRLKPKKNLVFPRYLWYILNSQYSKNYVKKIVGTTTYPNLKWILYGKHPITLPSPAEQQRVAAILDQADSIRRKNRQILEKYNELAQSVFCEMFGTNNHNFYLRKKIKVRELAAESKGSMRTGPFGSDLLHSEFTDSGIAVLGIDNVVENRFNWKERRFITDEKYAKLKRYTVRPNDVLISIMGTIGRSAVVPSDIGLAINTKHLAAITVNPEICNPYFLSFSFHSDPYIKHQFNSNGRGAIMNGLNLSIIKDLGIIYPNINEQNEFAKILFQIETQKHLADLSLEKSEEMFQSLLQRAFKGEL